jgi:hypothetical protein
MVRRGGAVDTFDEQKKREKEGGPVKQRHELHQVVIYELSRKQLRVVTQNKGSARYSKCSHSVALELQMRSLVRACPGDAAAAAHLWNEAAWGERAGIYVARQQDEQSKLECNETGKSNNYIN